MGGMLGLQAQQELIEERGRALAEMRNRLDSEGGQRQRVHAQYDKTLGLLKLLQKELLASEDEREAAEKGLKELRQMAVSLFGFGNQAAFFKNMMGNDGAKRPV